VAEGTPRGSGKEKHTLDDFPYCNALFGMHAVYCCSGGRLPGPDTGESERGSGDSQGPFKPIYGWFGCDESNYTTMKYGKQLLRELHDLSPVPVYIRAHHLLTSGDGVPEPKWSSSNVFSLDANGKPAYDFTIIDQTFDEYRNADVRPMVELGFMPRDLAATVSGVNAYQIHYLANTMSGASNNPPTDHALWGELVRKYTEHLVERYGKQEVSTWYFEVWNESDGSYWHGTPAEYLRPARGRPGAP
jgi:xylan 1,4-beta-xylosidase